jgi:uncharacterized surface protein with fasciclin (FAS1) repeats
MVMNNQRNKYIVLLMLIAAVFTSCKSEWNKHDAITDPSLGSNLLTQIHNNPSLSTFSQYLTKTGYDKVIASSKTYTVWAPNNTAFANADQTALSAIVNDTAKLKQFIGGQIAFQSYITTEAQPSLRIQTLNGKSITFTQTMFEEANILQANLYSSNGILHIIDKPIFPKQNIWDYITDTLNVRTVGLLQKAYLLSTKYSFQDTALAVITGVDPLTGKPIPKPGTGIVTKYHYKDQTQDLSNETSQYTYFELVDAGYTTETNKVIKYFNTSTPDSTAKLAAFNVLKDLALPGVYTLANLPDTIVSPFGVKVPINKNNIVQTYNASNGIVYVISDVNFRIQDKIPPIVIQGENAVSFATTANRQNIYYRTKLDNNGKVFNDIYITGNSINSLPALYWANYQINNANTLTYRVSYRAINDGGGLATPVVFSQQLNFTAPYANTFPYTPVAILNYNEVYLGTYTINKYGYLSIYAVGNTQSGTSSIGLNSITLDYIKLTPIFQ